MSLAKENEKKQKQLEIKKQHENDAKVQQELEEKERETQPETIPPSDSMPSAKEEPKLNGTINGESETVFNSQAGGVRYYSHCRVVSV